MHKVVVSGTGLFTPPDSISNEELVASFNAWVRNENKANALEIDAGSREPLGESSVAFVDKASGTRRAFSTLRE